MDNDHHLKNTQGWKNKNCCWACFCNILTVQIFQHLIRFVQNWKASKDNAEITCYSTEKSKTQCFSKVRYYVRMNVYLQIEDRGVSLSSYCSTKLIQNHIGSSPCMNPSVPHYYLQYHQHLDYCYHSGSLRRFMEINNESYIYGDISKHSIAFVYCGQQNESFWKWVDPLNFTNIHSYYIIALYLL